MEQALRQRTILLLSIAMIVLSTALMAPAQTGRFAVNYEQFSGKVTFEDRRKTFGGPRRVDTTFLEPMVQKTWDKVRAELTTFGHNFLNERDVGGGIRTSRNRIHLAEKGYLFFSPTSTGFSLQYRLPGNFIETSFRTPGPLPAFTDPRVGLGCDVILKVDIFWTGSKLTIPPANAIIGCRDPYGRNLTGELALGVINLIKTLNGPDFVKQWLAPINNNNFPLGQEINLDISKYTGGKIGQNTQVSVSKSADGTKSFGQKVSRLIIAIEDKEKEYVIH